MAKFFEISEENQKLFDALWEETGMYNYIDLKVIGTTKAKEVIKISKMNNYAEYFGKCPDSIVATVFEEVFDKLDDRNKRLLVEDVLGIVSYDTEKDKIIVGAPQVTITVGGRIKYGEELIDAAELAVTLIQEFEEEKKAQKEAEKAAKKTSK